MIKLIYIHGFKSSGESDKSRMLKQAFPNATVEAPTLSPRPATAISQIESIIKRNPSNTILVGTSLGGFYSLYLASKFDIPAFIINPSLEPNVTLISKVGTHTRYGSDEEYDFKLPYIDELDEMVKQLASMPKPGNLLHVYLSEDDELLSFEKLDSVIPVRKLTRWFKSAGHRFTKFSEVIPDIQEVINDFEKS
jgi:predicted esterase YcpF (UPF0227 family)